MKPIWSALPCFELARDRPPKKSGSGFRWTLLAGYQGRYQSYTRLPFLLGNEHLAKACRHLCRKESALWSKAKHHVSCFQFPLCSIVYPNLNLIHQIDVLEIHPLRICHLRLMPSQVCNSKPIWRISTGILQSWQSSLQPRPQSWLNIKF